MNKNSMLIGIARYLLLLQIISFIFISLSLPQTLHSKLIARLSKNDIQVNIQDSILFKFHLSRPSETTIKYINIYGGGEIVIEENESRTSGWHEIKIHSNLLRSRNYSSGVYYLDFHGKSDKNRITDFNSFQEPWGELVTASDIQFSGSAGTISYSLPKLSIARIRIGIKDGGLFRTFNLAPQVKGVNQVDWDGYDQTGTVNDFGNIDPTITILSYGLPKTALLLKNDNKPIDYSLSPAFPNNWAKYAISNSAKLSWDNSFDTYLEFDIEMINNDSFKISFLAIKSNQEKLDKIFTSDNEIYISVDGEFFIENNQTDLSTELTIAIPALSSGKHQFIVNAIFENQNCAIGLKEVIVE